MTTNIQNQPGIPPSDYAKHLDRVMHPTTPKFGRLFKLPSYRRSVGLDASGRYDWVLFVVALGGCLAAFAWLYFCFYE
jgi:hypothetical protein